MRLNIRALAVSCAILWGGAMLLMTLSAMIWPGYGQAFRELTASLYPGYHVTASLGDVMIGGLYGGADGAAGGAVFAWVYNSLVTRPKRESRTQAQ